MLTARYVTCRLLLLLALFFFTAGAVWAQRSDVYVPDDLEPWQDWVLHGKEYRACPFFFDRQPDERGDFVCAWPGELDLAVTADGGRFTQAWNVYADEQWVSLPGNTEHWPEQVTADGRSISVVLQNGAPAVRLAAGSYTLSGRFAWNERPRALPVPAETGLFRLTVDGVLSPFPALADSALWLGEQEAPRQERDAIRVEVYRLVADDVPTRLTTRLSVQVSGSVREEVIGPALPAGFVPIALHSALPVRLEADGNLRIQVRPGHWPIELLARGAGVMDEVTLPEPSANLPASEIWSYQSNDPLRVTVPEGLPPADPAQVSAPDEWQGLPAFHAVPGATLSIVERSRGLAATDNQLRLARELWLDFDGGGFTFSDTIAGTMRGGWRLDMSLPYKLLSASEDQEPLLVTTGAEEGVTGVELRRTEVDLQALGRRQTRGAAPVSGWQTRFDSVVTELNLPPGHKLLASGGADRAAGAWMERWRLLDFFLVLIITLATARLFGWQAGAVAFLALVLCWHETGAPRWLWLNLLAATALVRVAPVGRLRKSAALYRGLGFAALIILLVPFIAAQLRIAIYPQLEPQGRYDTALLESPAAAPAEDAAVREMKRAVQPAQYSAAGEEIVVTAARRSVSYARYAPNAVVQAGPGLPSWRWNTYQLHWNGPVDPEQTFRLTIMPRWLVTLLRFALVLLLVGFAAVFVFEIFNQRWQWPPRKGAATGSLLAVMIVTLVAAAGFSAPEATRADTPSPDILQQLQLRLLEPPPCTPRCAEIAEAEVDVGQQAMVVELVVHAEEDVAVPLPGSLHGWRPESVQVDGAALPQVYRARPDTLWIRITEGRHRITLDGPLPPVDGLEVPFPATPRAIAVQSEDWTVSGIRDRRLVAGALQLTRVQDEGSDDAAARWESSRFPQFAHIERTIELDLDWRVRTRVFRVAPEQGALTMKVPLLDGESVLSPGISVADGEVLVAMDASGQIVQWESTLARTSPLVLQVAEDAPWKEVWRFGIGNIWHVSFSGVPESEPQDAEGVRFAEFYPRGGEMLTLEAARPEASPGTTLAFDNVTVTTEIGARSRNVDMVLEYRSTRGAQHVITLPPGAEVLAVEIDGRNEPLRAPDGELSVPILPGAHTIHVRWRRDGDLTVLESAPRVDLGAAAGNLNQSVQLPANRWILATSGPRLGPAVMYWSELAALILFAFILGRIDLTPLRTRHWLLLGLGFSTFSWPVLALVAIWLLGSGARRRWSMDTARWWQFDLVQVVFTALTIVALIAIVATVPTGLLGAPDMHIVGNGSYGNNLRWFADRTDASLPETSVISVPLWVYKVLILAWALWLSFALLRWLPWVWQCFIGQGLWRHRKAASSKGNPSGMFTT
jgi:hypothetical protein